MLGGPSCKMNLFTIGKLMPQKPPCALRHKTSVIKAEGRPLHVTSIPRNPEATDVYQ